MDINNLPSQEYDRLGEKIAEVFNLKKSKTNKDRWQLGASWSDKTNKGLVLSLIEIARRIKMGEDF